MNENIHNMRGTSMKISERFAQIEKKLKMKGLTLGMPKEGEEPTFSSNGCEICANGDDFEIQGGVK